MPIRELQEINASMDAEDIKQAEENERIRQHNEAIMEQQRRNAQGR